jgi:hypothetical protein
MGKTRYELDTRILTIFFFVAMPFVAFGSFIVVGMARGALTRSLGAAFEQRAFESRFLLERYVSDQTDHLRSLAGEPQLQSALPASAQALSPEERRALDQAWGQPAESPLTKQILASPLAARLRDILQVHADFKLLQLVDANGRLVASSSRGGRALNDEAPWFQGLIRDGTRTPWVGDIHRPTPSSPAVLELAFPVYDDQAQLRGAVRGLVDAARIYAILAPVRLGQTGHATLVRGSDGVILTSDESQQILRGTFPGFPQIEAALRERRGSWTIPAVSTTAPTGEPFLEPARLVGYSPVAGVPSVQWLVVVEQDLAEAEAPVRQVTKYLWVHFIGAFGTVILLALYFSFKLEAPVIDEKLHLHEEHVPSDLKQAS